MAYLPRIHPSQRALQFVGLFAVMGLLSAFTLQPISQNFGTTGPESSQVFQVHNPGTQAIAMRFEMLERRVDESGVESNPPARGSFSIFPAQFILEAGQRRNVRVRYTGPQDLQRESSYRLLAEQLPVDLSEAERAAPQRGEGSIQIMFRYLASVFVVPAGAAGPQPRVSVAERSTEGESGVLLRFENSGGRHVVLHDLALRLELEDGSELRVTADQLSGIAGTNLLAGSTRTHFLALSPDAAARVRSVQLIY